MSESTARVLLVEDEAAFADAVLYALRSEGYAPEHCLLCRDTLARLRADPADVVVLDVGLCAVARWPPCSSRAGNRTVRLRSIATLAGSATAMRCCR